MLLRDHGRRVAKSDRISEKVYERYMTVAI
jgi:hypothetical protein